GSGRAAPIPPTRATIRPRAPSVSTTESSCATSMFCGVARARRLATTSAPPTATSFRRTPAGSFWASGWRGRRDGGGDAATPRLPAGSRQLPPGGDSGPERTAEAPSEQAPLRRGGLAALRPDLRPARVLPDALRARDPPEARRRHGDGPGPRGPAGRIW